VLQGVARLAGVEPTTSGSAGLRSIQAELQARVVPKEGFEPTRASAHCALNAARLPFRHFGTVVGGTGFEPMTSCV
jgi:hypothetical protein